MNNRNRNKSIVPLALLALLAFRPMAEAQEPAQTTYAYVPLLKACRLLDTRFANKPLRKEERRIVQAVRAQGNCNIPEAARLLWVNVTILPQSKPFGFITLYPEGTGQPDVSLMNALDGQLRSNAAIVGLSAPAPPPAVSIPNEYKGGAFTVYVTDPTHVLIDVSGYFVAVDTIVFEGSTVATPQPGGGKRIIVKQH